MATLNVVRKIMGDTADKARADLNGLKDFCLAGLAQIEVLRGQELTADTWEQAEATQREIARVRWEIESAEKKIPAAEQRLASLQAAEREELLASLTKRWSPAYRAFSTNAKVTRQSFDEMVRVIDSLRSHGFEQQAQALIVNLPPHIGGSPILNDAALADHPPAVRTSSPPAPIPKATKAPKPRAGAIDSQRAISAAEPAPTRTQKLRALRSDPVTADKILVRYTRPNVETPPAGVLSLPGDIVALDPEHARTLVASGAADLVQAANAATGG